MEKLIKIVDVYYSNKLFTNCKALHKAYLPPFESWQTCDQINDNDVVFAPPTLTNLHIERFKETYPNVKVITEGSLEGVTKIVINNILMKDIYIFHENFYYIKKRKEQKDRNDYYEVNHYHQNVKNNNNSERLSKIKIFSNHFSFNNHSGVPKQIKYLERIENIIEAYPNISLIFDTTINVSLRKDLISPKSIIESLKNIINSSSEADRVLATGIISNINISNSKERLEILYFIHKNYGKWKGKNNEFKNLIYSLGFKVNEMGYSTDKFIDVLIQRLNLTDDDLEVIKDLLIKDLNEHLKNKSYIITDISIKK